MFGKRESNIKAFIVGKFFIAKCAGKVVEIEASGFEICFNQTVIIEQFFKRVFRRFHINPPNSRASRRIEFRRKNRQLPPTRLQFFANHLIAQIERCRYFVKIFQFFLFEFINKIVNPQQSFGHQQTFDDLERERQSPALFRNLVGKCADSLAAAFLQKQISRVFFGHLQNLERFFAKIHSSPRSDDETGVVGAYQRRSRIFICGIIQNNQRRLILNFGNKNALEL